MRLSRFAPPLDARSVVHHLGGLLELASPFLLVPAVVGVIAGEPTHAATFVGVAAAAFAVGWLVRRIRPSPLRLREAALVVALAYPLLTVVSAGVYLPVAGPTDAIFETLSGYTTTGLTVMGETELPTSLLFFRSYSQWLGGAGIAIVYLAVLVGPGGTAARLYSAELDEENVLGNVVSSARAVTVAYLGVSLAGYVALVAAGAGWFDGLLHTFSLSSTGGFSPFSQSIGAYDSAAIATVTAVFMVIGATSLPLIYLLVAQRRWRSFVGDVQLRLLLALAAAGALVHLAFAGWSPTQLGAHLFNAVSAVTTTGFVVSDPGAWADGVKLATAGLMLVGGAAGSTAGGIKLLRLAVLLRLGGWVSARSVLPREAKVPLQIRGVAIGDEQLRRAVAVALSFVLLLFASSVTLTAAGVDAADALFETASAIGGVGQSAGVTGPDLAGWGKLVLGVDMWLGRIEVLPVLFLVLRPRRAR